MCCSGIDAGAKVETSVGARVDTGATQAIPWLTAKLLGKRLGKRAMDTGFRVPGEQ